MKNKTTARGEGKRLTDEQLKYVVGGVSTDGFDPNADEAKMIEDAIAELDALVGDPEAVNKKMKELMELGLLEEVNEALEARAETLGAQNGTPSEEPGNAEGQPTAAETPSVNTETQPASTPTTSGRLPTNTNMNAIEVIKPLSKNSRTPEKSPGKLPGQGMINAVETESSLVQRMEEDLQNLRSSDQLPADLQSGNALLKTADAALSSTIDILKTLKEKVIAAANDTNTEVDRAAIQNEIDASLQQIDDNALVTFNGKFLNNGSRTLKGVATANVMYTQQFIDTEGKLADLTDKDGNDLGLDSTDLVTFSVVKGGRTYSVTTPIGNMSFADLFKLQGTSGDESVAFDDILRLVDKDELVYDSANAPVYMIDNKPSVRVISNEAGLEGQISGITIKFTDQNGEMRTEANSAIDSFSEMITARNASMDNSIVLQIGANANNVMKLSIDDMSASALGLSGTGGTISVMDRTSATAALEVIDNALQRALNQEASIGATMNSLEPTSRELTTSSENLQSAENPYRDTDMAGQPNALARNQVLQQAAQSMLALYNQTAQNVLSLLQ